MHRIDNSTAVTTMPTPAVVGPNPNGFFTDGDAATPTPATIVDDDFLNSVQEELCNAITGMGGTLSKTNFTGLLSVLQKLTPYTGLIASGGSNNSATSGVSLSTSVSFTPARNCIIYVNGQGAWTNGSSGGAGFITTSGSGFTVQNQGGVSNDDPNVSCISTYSGILMAAAGTPVDLVLTVNCGSNIGDIGINFTYIEVPTS